MKIFVIFALVLALAVPFLAYAHNHTCMVDCRANGPVEFGQRPEWKDAPVRKDPLGYEVQDISGTEWFKSQMRSIAQQLKAKGLLSFFPSFQVWAN
jgi:hypothetical protein